MCLKASQSVIPMSKLTFACYETHISYSMMRICKGSALQVGCNDLPILLYTPHFGQYVRRILAIACFPKLYLCQMLPLMIT